MDGQRARDGVDCTLHFYHPTTPRKMKFEINHDGIKLNDKEHKYNELNKFWIIYQPPEVKNLYLEIKSIFKPNLVVPLEKENPLNVRAFLRQYVEEDLDQEEEPMSDAIGRLLKM